MANPGVIAEYLQAAADVATELEANGCPVDIYRPSGAVDPVAGTGAVATKVGEGFALFTSKKLQPTADGSIKLNDRMMLISVAMELEARDQIQILGRRYTVIDVKEINPAGVVNIVSKVQVRS